MRKVGEKARVKGDLKVGKIYGNDSFVIEMAHMLGKDVTIKSVNEYSNKYCIQECGFNWTSEMLEDVKPRFKVGDRVIVVKSNKVEGKDTKGKEKLVGAVGVIDAYGKPTSKTFDGVLYEHSIVFEDRHAQMSNRADGVWVFADEELSLVTRVEVGQDYKLIVNHPAIIYVLKKDGKEYKGVAKVMEGDKWDEKRGIEIAKTKAEMKVLELKLKKLSK